MTFFVLYLRSSAEKRPLALLKIYCSIDNKMKKIIKGHLRIESLLGS